MYTLGLSSVLYDDSIAFLNALLDIETAAFGALHTVSRAHSLPFLATYLTFSSSPVLMSGYQTANSADLDEIPGHDYVDRSQKRTSAWVKIGVPVALLVVIGAVLGGVLGTQLNKGSSNVKNSSGLSSTSLSPQESSSIAASVSSAKVNLGRFATGTDTYGLPIYPTTTNPAIFGNPTFVTQSPTAAWPTDTFKPSNPAPTNVRTDRPRLIAPKYKWDACACEFLRVSVSSNSC